MDEGRRLKRLAGRFAGQFLGREPPQFVIHERKKLISGGRIAPLDRGKRQRIGGPSRCFACR
jgi:hypothetical protein